MGIKYKKAVIGVNDLISQFPDLAAELHPTKNSHVDVSSVTYGARMPLVWICPLGHEYEASPNARTSGQCKTCPYCTGHRVLKGYNDLITTHPHLTVEWHPDKNLMTAGEISFGSHTKVWWQCDKGHEWQSKPNTRTIHRNCPYCSGNKVWIGFNDLASVNPLLASQWHPTKNGKLKPEDFSEGSHKKVWWLCDRGHEWEAVIKSRKIRGCWSCIDKTSKAERQIRDLLEKNGFTVVCNNRYILSGKELDIYLPSFNLAIEYNGVYWHSDLNGCPEDFHYEKWKNCKAQGINLIHIYEIEYENTDDFMYSLLGLLKKGLLNLSFSEDGWVENGSLEELWYSLNGFTRISTRPPTPKYFSLNRRCSIEEADALVSTDKIAKVFNAGWSQFEILSR